MKTVKLPEGEHEEIRDFYNKNKFEQCLYQFYNHRLVKENEDFPMYLEIPSDLNDANMSELKLVEFTHEYKEQEGDELIKFVFETSENEFHCHEVALSSWAGPFYKNYKVVPISKIVYVKGV